MTDRNASFNRRLVMALAALAVVLTGCGSPSSAGPGRRSTTHVTLWLDYTPWGVHVPIFAARREGYFKRQGLDISIRVPSDLTLPLKLVAAGGNTVGIGYMSDVVSAEAQGIPVESIGALVQHHLNSIMTLKSSGITSPTQLAGKRVGAAETPADSVILDTVFKHAGVSGKVQRVNLNYDYVQALLSHRVDAIEGAYQVWERIQIEQQGARVNVIQLQDWGVPDEYELVLLAGRRMMETQPATLSRFMRALTAGAAFSIRHPRRAVADFMAANPKSGRGLVLRSWRLLIPFVRPPGVPFATQAASRWRGLAAWMFKNRLVSRRLPARRLFTSRFLG